MISLRILSFNGQETLSEITEEIMRSKSETLSLLFPRKAHIFIQKTDLQSLRDFCDTQNKYITIITKNSKARKEIESIGIKTLPSLEYADDIPLKKSLNLLQNTSDQLENSEETEEHISDTDLSREENTNTILERLETKPNTDTDASKVLARLNISHIPIDTRISKPKTQPQTIHRMISKPVLHSFFILTGIATLLFGFIITTVIPAANIIITPSKKEAEMHINIHFLDEEKFTEPELWEKNNGLFMVPLHENFQFTSRFTQVSKEFYGENAQGSIKLINTTNEDITLRQDTKLQFKDNLIIELPEWTTIPQNGNVIIHFTMPPKDIYGSIVGEKGNKEKGEKLNIPGLPEEMQKEIYAEVESTFTGGVSEWKYKITKDDFEKAKLFFKQEAFEKAKIEAQKLLREKNTQHDVFQFISPIFKTLQVEILEYKFADNEEEFQKLLSKEQGFIDAKIKVRMKIYVYNTDNVIQLLEMKYKQITPDGMFLKSVNKDYLTSFIQTLSDESSQVKASFSTRGIYEYALNTKTDAEKIFIMNAKKHILSLPKEEAQNRLINNFKEIATAEIELSPFWVRTLPSLLEKLTITIEH